MSVKIFWRTYRTAATAKAMPLNSCAFLRELRNPCDGNLPLNAPCPPADGRMPAAVGQENRQGIGCPGLAVDGDEDAAARGERFENAAVMRLKSDAAHRAGDSELSEVPRIPLERRDQWTAGQHS